DSRYINPFPTRRSSDLLYPASGSENLLHGRFRAKNKKIDHITRMALLVRDTPRDFGEKSTVDAGDGAELLGHGVRLAVFRSVHRSEEHTSELQSLRHLV